MMNINELPEEILVRILSFLPPSDRLESTLTCRQWAQTVARAPPLLRDIWLVNRSGKTCFANCHRDYENLRLRGARALSFNTTFLANVGPNLRKLEIDGCGGLPDVFYSILQACCNLESLEIRIGYDLGYVDSTRLRILAGLPKLRNLKIYPLRMEAESLRIIAFDLKKLQTLDISGDAEGFYSGYQRSEQRSELQREISTHLKHIRSERQGELDSSSLEVLKLGYLPLTDACLRCATAYHRRLRVVHFEYCPGITDTGLVTLFQHEPLLEELRVHYMDHLDGTFLEGLEEQCPRLRSVRIGCCLKISDQAWEKFILRRPEVKYGF